MATRKLENSNPKPDTMKVENGRFIVDVAIGKGSPSASGKSLVFFSTRGNVALEDGYSVGINLYKRGR